MSQEFKIVTFMLGQDEYGLEITYVDEIRNIDRITHVPQAPDFVEGVFKYRDKTIPLLDLRKRMKMLADKDINSHKVIIVEIDNRILGLIADAVGEVLSISPSSIDVPDSVLSTADYLKSVIRMQDRIILLINLEKIHLLDEVREDEKLSETVSV